MREELHEPAAPSGDGLVLTHGAGGNARAPLLVALGEAFTARGITVLQERVAQQRATREGLMRERGEDIEALGCTG